MTLEPLRGSTALYWVGVSRGGASARESRVYRRKRSCAVCHSRLWQRMQGFAADPVYGRAKCLPMLGSLTT